MTKTIVKRQRGAPRTTRNLFLRTTRMHKDVAERTYAKGATFENTKVSSVYAAVLATAVLDKDVRLLIERRIKHSEGMAKTPLEDQVHVSLTFPSKSEGKLVIDALNALTFALSQFKVKQYQIANVAFHLWTQGKFEVPPRRLSAYRP